jgi:hypothetical protein
MALPKYHGTCYHHRSIKAHRKSQKNGSKQIDTSELIRSYGELKHDVTQVTPPIVTEVTPSNVTYGAMETLVSAVATMQNQQELDRKENVLLRKQLLDLTDTVKQLTNILEHKPDLVVQEVKASGGSLAEKAVEAAVIIEEPVSPVTAPLTSSYLDDIPSFLGNR